MARSDRLRWLATVLCAPFGLLAFVAVAAAHGGGGLGGAAPGRLAVPTWLVVLTGGGAVGASFLLASLATDRAFLDALHGRRRRLPGPGVLGRWLGRGLGLAGLALVLIAGVAGPADPVRNAAVLLVWVGWWAGLVAATALVGNAWPVLDPARTLAQTVRRFAVRLLGDHRHGDRLLADHRHGDRTRPVRGSALLDRYGPWAATAGLLALAWLATVAPLDSRPGLLALAVGGYVAVGVVGAALFGDPWFDRVDPVARLFRTVGRVAPVQRTGSGPALRLPGSALADEPSDDDGSVAFVLALLWGTTFDGLVTTPAWAAAVEPLVAAGVPPRLVYLGGLLAGFGVFLAGFRLAAAAARRTAPTFLTGSALARRFAPSLVPIAVGYHLAHHLPSLLALSPVLATVLATPWAPPAAVPTMALPGWVGALPLVLVLSGHLLAVWVAHAIAYRTFPGRLQAVRSQLPFTATMVAYTTVSLWIVSRPSVTPPAL